MVVACLAGVGRLDGCDRPCFDGCKLAQVHLRRSHPQQDFVDFLWIYARKSQKITIFHSVSKNVKTGDLSSKLEPALGFEPRTDGLYKAALKTLDKYRKTWYITSKNAVFAPRKHPPPVTLRPHRANRPHRAKSRAVSV